MGVVGLTSAMRCGPGRPAQAWEALSGRSDQNTVSSEYTTCSRAGKGRGRLMDVVGRPPATRPIGEAAVLRIGRKWYVIVGADYGINISPPASPGCCGRGCSDTRLFNSCL
ncbi:hypothetical protein TIFTF001_011973 [Ficus carica]|uniref:Uncharacterized protein n=1 Tax=Ficus carica TaxID=3494 RepID=A0AA88A0Y1_FICCA|nr:hypothetical protein TIFTF001_011973 [Ficus carica]